MPEKYVQAKMEQFLDEMLCYEFINKSCGITKEPEKDTFVRVCMIKSMLLSDREYWRSFAKEASLEAHICRYIEMWEEKETSMQQNLFRSAIEFLGQAFLEKEVVVKIEWLPLLTYLAEDAQDKEMTPEDFRTWWHFLRKECLVEEML